MFPDWTGKPQPVPQIKGDVCDDRDDLSICLLQQSRHRFAVVYGLQVKTGLRYAQAAAEYGECVMHSLACRGKIRN